MTLDALPESSDAVAVRDLRLAGLPILVLTARSWLSPAEPA